MYIPSNICLFYEIIYYLLSDVVTQGQGQTLHNYMQFSSLTADTAMTFY